MEDFLVKNSKLLVFSLVGLVLIAFGALLYKIDIFSGGDKVEVLSSTTEGESVTTNNGQTEIVVEINGSVEMPGVYTLKNGSRVDDLLTVSGGLSVNADRSWVDKNINRASKLLDSQKVYIYSQSEVSSAKASGSIKLDQGILQVETGGLVNINTSSLSELDSLPGIGHVYAQKIIEHRPYSSLEELVSKGVVGQSLFEKIKSSISL